MTENWLEYDKNLQQRQTLTVEQFWSYLFRHMNKPHKTKERDIFSRKEAPIFLLMKSSKWRNGSYSMAQILRKTIF